MILQSFSFILLKKWILEKYLLQNPKSQRMEERWNKKERERERGKSSSITIAQDMVRKLKVRGVPFILGEANLPLLDQCQVSTTKYKRESQG
jgi:hypothetical protein